MIGIIRFSKRQGGVMALRSQIRRRQIRENIVSHLIILFFLGTLLMIPGVSTAGGLYINEFGTPSMGVAGAGANAVASDAPHPFTTQRG